MEKTLTLVLVRQENSVLLGMKKRGFGEGRWNGFGGKLEPGETIIEAAHRELEEEVGVHVENLHQVAQLRFTFASDSELALKVHVFLADTLIGEPEETEEMRPQWFSFDTIPYEEMWPDDVYWLPKVLAGKLVEGSFHFDAPASAHHQATILSSKVNKVDGF